jgi:hypothetical protein
MFCKAPQTVDSETLLADELTRIILGDAVEVFEACPGEIMVVVKGVKPGQMEGSFGFDDAMKPFADSFQNGTSWRREEVRDTVYKVIRKTGEEVFPTWISRGWPRRTGLKALVRPKI